MAIAAGFITPIFRTLIDGWFDSPIFKRYESTVKETISKSLLSGLVVGWLLGIIFYAFAVTDAAPIKFIIFFTVAIGLISPLLTNLFSFFRMKINS